MPSVLAGLCESEPLMSFATASAINNIPTTADVLARIQKGLLPHQQQFCDDIDHRKLALVCGFGAGKTHALVTKAVHLGCLNVGYVSALFEPTAPMLRDIL